MHKLKSKFSRRHHSRDDNEEKRSDIFIKRLSQQSEDANDQELVSDTPPQVQLEDLSQLESTTYLAWWNDLDPFHIGKSDNTKLFRFVSGCNLSEQVLEQIVSLFGKEKDGLNKEQFFAMLRLIAHAQNGRSIQRDLVHLGAPLPTFKTQAIDALIENTHHSHLEQPLNTDIPTLINQSPIATTLPLCTPPPQFYSHSRSRSVPYTMSNIYDSPDPPFNTSVTSDSVNMFQRRQHANHSGPILSNADCTQPIINKTSLLLTQGFQPRVDSKNPFDTDDSVSSTPREEYTPPIYLPQSPPYTKPTLLNNHPNSHNMHPPLVPPQSTKPIFPKYAHKKVNESL